MMKPYTIFTRSGMTGVYVYPLKNMELVNGEIVGEPNGELAGMEFLCVNEAALGETLAWLAEKGYK